MERSVGPYKVKKIVSLNAVELELPNTIKIHLVVNVSRIHKYVGQVEGQKREQPAPVIIDGEEEWEVEEILNKRQIRGKDSQWNQTLGKEGKIWEMQRKQSRNLKESINRT